MTWLHDIQHSLPQNIQIHFRWDNFVALSEVLNKIRLTHVKFLISWISNSKPFGSCLDKVQCLKVKLVHKKATEFFFHFWKGLILYSASVVLSTGGRIPVVFTLKWLETQEPSFSPLITPTKQFLHKWYMGPSFLQDEVKSQTYLFDSHIPYTNQWKWERYVSTCST